METIKNKLLSTAAIPKPAAKNESKSESESKSSVEAKIERDQSRLKPSVPEEPHSFRAHNAPHDYHQRHGDRGDSDADGGEDDGPYRLPGRKLLTRHLCARYRVSDRTIDRWTADPRLEFPQPTIINGRRYWDESEIAAFDAKQKEAAA